MARRDRAGQRGGAGGARPRARRGRRAGRRRRRRRRRRRHARRSCARGSPTRDRSPCRGRRTSPRGAAASRDAAQPPATSAAEPEQQHEHPVAEDDAGPTLGHVRSLPRPKSVVLPVTSPPRGPILRSMKRLALVLLAAFALIAGAGGRRSRGLAVAADRDRPHPARLPRLGDRGQAAWARPPPSSSRAARGWRSGSRARWTSSSRRSAGRPLALGASTFQAGTTRYVVFRRPGTYKLRARNLQTPEEAGLQTLGADNTPILTIVAR